MAITLKKANVEDWARLYDMQVKCFKEMLAKYQDYDYSPAAEEPGRTKARLLEPGSDYYFICLDGEPIGGLRVFDYGDHCKLKRIYILPEHQNSGYGRQAVRLAEAKYPAAKTWQVDIILQEDRICRFFERLGYVRTGRVDGLKYGMDVAYYAK